MEFGGIGFSEGQGDLMEVASGFCRERSPIAQVRALIDSENGFDAAVWQEMAELGWMAIAVPEQFGGVGLSLAEEVPVVEQMGRNLLASPFVSTTLAAQALLAGGSESQKAEWLPKLASGGIATLAMSEAHGDWDLLHIDSTAIRDGDYLKLSGTKHFVLWADSADLALVSVRIDGRPAMAVLTKDNLQANALRRETIIDETKRTFALSLDGISISADAVLDSAPLEALGEGALLLQSAEMCGGTQAVIDYTLGYLQTRKQFGKLIGEYQALKHPMVDAYVAYEKARSHLYGAAHCHGEQGRGAIAAHMAKAAADKAYAVAADRAIQFHGAFGFTHDCDAGLHRRAAIFHASQHGDAAWHRAKLADLLLA
jgi:alkylation response protein AidB-like acyl-CoA dehydrogenase